MPSIINNNIHIPAVGEITDITDTRIVLLQSGRLVSAPLASIANLIIDAASLEALLLSGDEQHTGFDRIELSGDESGDLLLN